MRVCFPHVFIFLNVCETRNTERLYSFGGSLNSSPPLPFNVAIDYREYTYEGGLNSASSSCSSRLRRTFLLSQRLCTLSCFHYLSIYSVPRYFSSLFWFFVHSCLLKPWPIWAEDKKEGKWKEEKEISCETRFEVASPRPSFSSSAFPQRKERIPVTQRHFYPR